MYTDKGEIQVVLSHRTEGLPPLGSLWLRCMMCTDPMYLLHMDIDHTLHDGFKIRVDPCSSVVHAFHRSQPTHALLLKPPS